MFRNCKGGRYAADLIVENVIVVELKCCTALLPEHKAQGINYLKASGISVGLLINFEQQKLEYKRLHHPNELDEVEQLRQKIHALMRSDEQT